MPEFAGITSLHCPEQFMFEGLAQTLPLFMENKYTENNLLRARIYLSHFSSLIFNNIHTMINKGKEIEDCVEYALSSLPYLKEKDVVSGLTSRSNNLLFRSYRYIYPKSFDYFIRLSEKLDIDEKKDLLKGCFTDILYYEDFVKKYPDIQ